MTTILILVMIILGTSIIWVPALLIVLFLKSKNSDAKPEHLHEQNVRRDQQWSDYIASFQQVATTKKEHLLLEAILQGKTPEEYGSAGHAVMVEAHQDEVIAQPMPLPPVYEEEKEKEPIDSTLLLLYFGAFLLVASVGLFVAIGGLDGAIRVLIVAITSGILFFGGLRLYEKSKKLAVAGISFVGSGMIIAPLTGVAWYNLVSNRTDGALIWFVTSIVCIAMYAYAYKRIKNDFMAYLLIGSFVSSVESSILMVSLPSYGYAWGLVVVGILLAAAGRLRQDSGVFGQSSSTSASLLIPLSIIGSIALLPEFGSTQFAVTLFLASIYYGMLSSWETTNQRTYRLAAQVSCIAGIMNLVYAGTLSFVALGVTLTIFSIVYSLVIATTKKENVYSYGLNEITATVSVLAVLCSVSSAWSLVAALAASVLFAAVLWQKNRSDEALQVGGMLLIVLPFVAGQYALSSGVGSLSQLSLCAAAALILGVLTILTVKSNNYQSNYSTAAGLYWSALVAVLIPAAALGFVTLATTVAVILVSCLALKKLSKDYIWFIGSSLVVFVPLVYAVVQVGFDSHLFSISVTAALLWNSAISLVTRQALTRWLVVITILLMPIAIGGGGLGFYWDSAGYSVGYVLAMLGCLAARAIARGRLLVSTKVPIASYYTEASQAYVVGYIVAAMVALFLSLDTSNSRLLTTVLLGVIAVVVVAVARIERKPETLVFLPVVLQAAILSAIRPDIQDPTQIGVTAIISVLAAGACYALATMYKTGTNDTAKLLQQVSVYLAYAGPVLALTPSKHSLLLPCSLFVAGLITLHYNYQKAQQNREWSVAVCIASVHWLLYIFGVHNIHIHTHLLAVSLAGFAYWRNLLQDKAASQSYVQALFLVITVPLVLQSLGNEAGGYYGLILIGEQVLFMIAGATLSSNNNGQRFLLRWGLWTALAAILFQLRGLGWAFVSFLAIIIIGTAVYRLQKKPLDK